METKAAAGGLSLNFSGLIHPTDSTPIFNLSTIGTNKPSPRHSQIPGLSVCTSGISVPYSSTSSP
eukprot:696269-Hanusia_phi.AAC.1